MLRVTRPARWVASSASIALATALLVSANASAATAPLAGLGSADFYASFNETGAPAGVSSSVVTDATDTEAVSEDGKTVVEAIPDWFFGGGLGSTSIYAVTPGTTGTMRKLYTTAESVESVRITSDGQRWFAGIDDASGFEVIAGSTVSAGVSGVSVVGKDLTLRAYLVTSANGQYGVALGQFADPSGNITNGYIEFKLDTGDVITEYSIDELMPSVPQMILSIPMIDNSGRIYTYSSTTYSAAPNAMFYHAPGAASWAQVDGTSVLPSGSRPADGNAAVSENGTALVIASGTMLTTYLLSNATGTLAVDLASKKTSPVPSNAKYYGDWLLPLVSDDGLRVAGGGGVANGGFWYGVADTNGGSAEVFKPAGLDAGDASEIVHWSANLGHVLYTDNNSFRRVGSPFTSSESTPTPTPTPTPPVTARVCHPVAILAFRGSGEKNVEPGANTLSGDSLKYGNSGLVTNGWEGPTLQRLLTNYAAQTYADGFKPASVPVIGLGTNSGGTAGYPAVAVPKSGNIGPVKRSAAAGATYAQTVMAAFQRSQPAGCKTTKFVLVGYSQGAVADRTVAIAQPSKVADVLNAGDPYQRSHAPGTQGSGAGGTGIFRSLSLTAGSLDAPLQDRYYRGPYTKASICHSGDPYCDFNRAVAPIQIYKHQNAQHENYYTMNINGKNEGADFGKVLADWVYRLSR